MKPLNTLVKDVVGRVKRAVNDFTLRGVVKAQIFVAQEPVRLRAALASGILAAGAWLGLDVSGYVEHVAVIGAVVLPIIVGESTRKRVSPTYDQ
jgi:energy-converting hydrogenase Eha subunit H